MHYNYFLVHDSTKHINPDSISPYLQRGDASQAFSGYDTHFMPFDFVPTTGNNFYFDTSSHTVESIESNHTGGMSGIPVAFTSHTQSLLFSIFAFCFVFLSIITRREGAAFLASFKSIFSVRSQHRSIFKEQITISGAWINLFLVVQTAVVLSSLGAYILWGNRIEYQISFDNLYQLITALFAGILLFIIAKYFIYRLIDYVFPDWGLQGWTSQYFTVIALIGLVTYLPVLLLVFSPCFKQVYIWLSVIGLGAVFFFSYRNLLIIFVKNNIGLLNYFLYLCAIEIVPLFLIYKSGIILANIAGKY